MTFSQPLTQEILRQLAGKTLVDGYVSGANGSGIYLGLSTADPGDLGASLAEPGSDINYSRIFLASSDWSVPTDAQPSAIDNLATQQFAAATGGAGWGSLSYLTAHTDSTAGNYIGAGVINGGIPIAIDDGDRASFASGAARITLL
jgi:hypothetical protein